MEGVVGMYEVGASEFAYALSFGSHGGLVNELAVQVEIKCL